MATNYIAVVADVVASRQVAERAELQTRLQETLKLVNDRFAGTVASRFVVTLGDEFQGLLHTPEGLQRILGLLRASLHPEELRLGLGLGRLDTPLQPQALGMDGPCFHHARAAVERAERLNTPVEVEAGWPVQAFAIYGALSGHIRRRWTLRQRKVADLSMSGMEGVDIAAQLSISPSAVSQHLRAAGWDALEQATSAWVEAIGAALQAVERMPL
jgi:hypothetical protein